MLSFFRWASQYSNSLPPEESGLRSKSTGKIVCAYFAIIYIFSYYLNNVCYCRISGLPGQLQSGLNFLFTLFLNDVNPGLARNINCFKTVIVFVAALTALFILVYWHFEKERLITAAQRGILNNNLEHTFSYVAVLGFAGFILIPYGFIFDVTPNTGRYRPWHYLYNDINHWVPQATRALAPFLVISLALLELWAQIIARKNIRQLKG